MAGDLKCDWCRERVQTSQAQSSSDGPNTCTFLLGNLPILSAGPKGKGHVGRCIREARHPGVERLLCGKVMRALSCFIHEAQARGGGGCGSRVSKGDEQTWQGNNAAWSGRGGRLTRRDLLLALPTVYRPQHQWRHQHGQRQPYGCIGNERTSVCVCMSLCMLLVS